MFSWLVCQPGKIRSLIKMIITEQELEKKIAKLTSKTIVFASGVFDLLHIGHLEYLKQAKHQGDILVVWVNSDQSVKAMGKDHPMIYSFKERAKLVANLKPVDFVVKFSESNPARVIKKFKPNVVARSGKCLRHNSVHCLVKELDGKMFYVNIIDNLSSTAIFKIIKEK